MALDYIWIVDDDAIFTFTAKRILMANRLTKRIDTFINGDLAKNRLDFLKTQGGPFPNVILLDINMPVIDGWQFMDEFSSLPNKKDIVIYLVSSSIDPKDREKALLYEDIQDFVVKPVTLKALRKLMTDAKDNLLNVSKSKL